MVQDCREEKFFRNFVCHHCEILKGYNGASECMFSMITNDIYKQVGSSFLWSADAFWLAVCAESCKRIRTSFRVCGIPSQLFRTSIAAISQIFFFFAYCQFFVA